MKTIFPFSAVLLLLVLRLPAQETPAPTPFVVTHAQRAVLARAVGKKDLSPAEAIVQLRASSVLTVGTATSPEADHGLAALDVGRRLLGMGRPELAEPFFVAAAELLEQAISHSSVKIVDFEKARYLATLASIRAEYLNQAKQARLDMAEAIRLRPDDPSLKRNQALIARENAEAFKSAAATKN